MTAVTSLLIMYPVTDALVGLKNTYNNNAGAIFSGLVLYICGVVGLILILNLTVSNAITVGVVPFIIGDVIKSIMAIGVAYKLK